MYFIRKRRRSLIGILLALVLSLACFLGTVSFALLGLAPDRLPADDEIVLRADYAAWPQATFAAIDWVRVGTDTARDIASETPTPTPQPTQVADASTDPSPEFSPTSPPTRTSTASPTDSPSLTLTVTVTETSTETVTPTATVTTSPTTTVTVTTTTTATTTVTTSPTTTSTRTSTPTITDLPSPTRTRTPTPTRTRTPLPTNTNPPPPPPTNTPLPTNTNPPPPPPTNTPLPTNTIPPVVPPTAINDTANTLQNQPVVINILANDIPGSFPIDPSAVKLPTSPTNGVITNMDGITGAVTYQPNAGFTGIDSFTYIVLDTAGYSSSPATVTINVGGCPPPLPIDGGLPDGYVAGISPSGVIIPPPSTIVVVFTQQMAGGLFQNVTAPGMYSVRATSGGGNIQVIPPVNYDPGTFTATVSLNQADFDPDTEYRIEINGGIVNACDVPQGGTVSTTFRTAP